MVALLRGINVGGKHMIGMAALRELLEKLGFRNVRTLLQSGNVVFETSARKDVGRKIEDALEETFGFRPAVILRTEAQLTDAIANNPHLNVPGNRLLVTFFAEGETYAYYPDGVGQSKVPVTRGGTARNWNTVLKLQQLLKDDEV